MTAKKGDNSVDEEGKQLAQYVGQIERLEAQRASLAEDIKEIYAAAKEKNFDPKIMKLAIRRRKMSADERRELDDMLDIYEHALETMLS